MQHYLVDITFVITYTQRRVEVRSVSARPLERAKQGQTYNHPKLFN